MRSKTGVGAYVYPAATAARSHAPTSVGGAAFACGASGAMTKGPGGRRPRWADAQAGAMSRRM